MIPEYPDSTDLSLDMRPRLHPLFQQLPDGVSEFTFANLYLFRHDHRYRISRLPGGPIVISGDDKGTRFFMLPFELPARDMLARLFHDFDIMKCIPASMKESIETEGYALEEDRNNFDYLYLRKNLAELTGRKFHKKRNLIKAFVSNYSYTGKPLLEEHLEEALGILESWREGHDDPGDYIAAKEALEKAEELQLCGGIYYVEDKPVAYSLGEELALGTSFVIHFEKAVRGYKGIWQFVNQAFASIIPEQYETLNREQDLGNEGLRRAKHSYKPSGYVKKYRAFKQ